MTTTYRHFLVLHQGDGFVLFYNLTDCSFSCLMTLNVNFTKRIKLILAVLNLNNFC